MMKALIVDDEMHVREAVRYFVPWENYGIENVFEAGNGKEAIEIIESERPALIFTDMVMPLMDGSQLLKWIHENSPRSKTIVISGYQDFNYVKPAIMYGGTDYLLKPLNAKQLVAAAERALSLWKQEEEEWVQSLDQKIQLNVLRPVYRDKLLSDLVSGTIPYAKLNPQQVEDELGLSSCTKKVVIAVLSLHPVNRRFLDRLHADLELASYVTVNVCNEVLAEGSCLQAFRYQNTGADVVMLFGDPDYPVVERLQKINEAMQRTYQVQFDIGIGSASAFPEGIQASFEESREALRRRNLLQRDNRIHLYRNDRGEEEAPNPFAAYIEKFRFAIMSGSSQRIEEVADEWYSHICGMQVITAGQLESWHEEYAAELLRLQKDLFSKRQPSGVPLMRMELPYDEDGRFSLISWKNQVVRTLQVISSEFTGMRNLDSQLVEDIKQYIHDNYHQEITLQHIANRFFISRENVSRKFKQVTRKNLSDYLSNLRIDKAKQLLKSSDLRLSQISTMVGFQDEKYFSRVFKKVTGKTPREYRKAEG
ncbi:response regulator [Paenibacillus sp. YPG26]|uniref:response regulator n=1 Tax=Paenibacillus sp. YPG26 TaxID=2878915 RepID=UPI00203EFDA0|nr:response regulator [Paenibacillus sp. YPG26]USB33002.1 response regulator [Paenibacillus sp. YPG26]